MLDIIGIICKIIMALLFFGGTISSFTWFFVIRKEDKEEHQN